MVLEMDTEMNTKRIDQFCSPLIHIALFAVPGHFVTSSFLEDKRWWNPWLCISDWYRSHVCQWSSLIHLPSTVFDKICPCFVAIHSGQTCSQFPSDAFEGRPFTCRFLSLLHSRTSHLFLLHQQHQLRFSPTFNFFPDHDNDHPTTLLSCSGSRTFWQGKRTERHSQKPFPAKEPVITSHEF